MMLDIAHIINELRDLLAHAKLSFEEADALRERYAYPPLQEYLHMLLHRVKPETATSELFKALAADVLKIEMLPEVSVKGGFVDFAIRPKEGNPIVLELKPAFKPEISRQLLHPENLPYPSYKAQIQKYLLSNEYVMLTNLRQMFIFSREALLDFRPFYQNDFAPFLVDYLAYENMWDYIRRIEDQLPRKDLDQAFFEDLKKWYGQLQTIALHAEHGLSNEELMVLFLNKMVFIKTLEDYGLIPFKFLEDTYLATQRRWHVKGDRVVFNLFFEEIESWCYEFYDTELFKTRFWNHVAPDRANIQAFKKVFEMVLGFGAWQQAFGKGLIHYNYRLIDEDVFGKAYETFLAERRKDSGIYYTPQPITRSMAEDLVQRLFDPLTTQIVQAIDADDYAAAQTLFTQVQQIKILDPCSGSGSFLIKVLRAIHQRYQRMQAALDAKTTAAQRDFRPADMFSQRPAHLVALGDFITTNGFDDPRLVLSKIILHHIYALDLDERALDTAKTNIWKEAIKLAPRFFNFLRLPEDRNHILPSLALNFIMGDSLADAPEEQALALLSKDFRDTLVAMHAKRDEYLRNPLEPNGMTEILRLKQPLLARLQADLPAVKHPALLAVEYFFAYFDRAGQPLPPDQRGFEAIISNPPWETIKPIRKEFADIGKGALDIKDFNKLFESKLQTDAEFKAQWDEYAAFYDTYRAFLRSVYQYQGDGDLNFYKLFVERDLNIIKPGGLLSILIPSGFQTDNGTAALRKLMFAEYTPLHLFSFENRGYEEQINGEPVTVKPFPDVDNRFKFSIVAMKKEKSDLREDRTFQAQFYLHDPAELAAAPIAYSQQMVKKFSPDNLSIMEFRAPQDYRLCAKIRGEHQLFGATGLTFRREFHMTDDSALFKKRRSAGDDLVLYEGKMIHQYHAHFADPHYYIGKDEGRRQLLSKEVARIKKELKPNCEPLEAQFDSGAFKLDYELYRFIYRAVASSTNERSLICTIIPPNVFTGNSVNYLINVSYAIENDQLVQRQVDYRTVVYLLALLNSLTLNYYIRNKISVNLNMFYLYELPIPTPTDAQNAAILHGAFSLLARNDTSGAFDDLGRAIGVTPDRETDVVRIRAALEVLIAKDVYGLSASDWEYLTSTFVYGSAASATRQELDAIMRVSRELFENP